MNAILEVPLAFASFVFYRIMRFVMRRLLVLSARLKGKKAYIWGVLSAESLRIKLALPVLMTTGPRWNTHALIGGAGPFAVKEKVSFDLAPLQASAKSWTAAIYRFPKQTLTAVVGSIDGPFPDRWHTIQLPPGKYNMVTRMYHRSDSIELPEIRIDGVAAIASIKVDPKTNDFYRDLPKRRSWFYSWMHFYIYTLLRLEAPRWLIERELLPMGNPETLFRYGALKRGEALRFRMSRELLAAQDVYFTLYTRDSFPALWYPIVECDHVTTAVRESGFYLVRVQRKLPGQNKADSESIQIQTV